MWPQAAYSLYWHYKDAYSDTCQEAFSDTCQEAYSDTYQEAYGDTIRKLTLKITVKLQWPHLTSSPLSKNVISDLFDFLVQSDPDSDKLEMLLARRMRGEDWTALLTYVSNSNLQVVNRFAITAGGEKELSSRLQDCSWTYKVLADGYQRLV